MAGCPAGWFSLNVPSGLTIYWFINNILSTAQQVLAHAAPSAPPCAWNSLRDLTKGLSCMDLLAIAWPPEHLQEPMQCAANSMSMKACVLVVV